MLCRTMLAVASLLATGTQAYAPIQMVSGQGKGLVVLPKGFPGSIRGALTPQKLSVRNPASDDSPSSVPYFTAKIDQTIIWDDAGWCLEATGNKHGNAVRVNICSGAQTQKWNWIPDGRGHNMIQLTDTDLCLDAIDNEVGSNGAPIELRGCGHEVAQWQFEEPLPLPGTPQADSLSYEARNVMITLLTLAGLGAVSFGARFWHVSATGNQNQEKASAELAFDSMQPSRVAQTRSSRTSNTSMAHGSVLSQPIAARSNVRRIDAVVMEYGENCYEGALTPLPENVYEVWIERPLGIDIEERGPAFGMCGVTVTAIEPDSNTANVTQVLKNVGGSNEAVDDKVAVGDHLVGVTAIQYMGAKWERKLFDCTSWDFERVVEAIGSNNKRFISDYVILRFERPEQSEGA